MPQPHSYELLLIANVDEIIALIKSASKDKEMNFIRARLVTALHDVVCGGNRFHRDELAKIIAFSKEIDHMMLQQDAESRLRNLV